MSLRLDLDYALPVIVEPGYFQHVSGWEAGKHLNPLADEDKQAFWQDPASGVVMKYPLQFNDTWLNSNQQTDSIIGLVERGSGILLPASADVSNFTVFEQNVWQNTFQPWVCHAPNDSSLSVPQNLSGQPGQADVGELEQESETGFGSLVSPGTPLPFDPFGNPPGAAGDLLAVAYSQADLAWNQPLYLRWFHADSWIGGTTIYGFMVGQYAFVCHSTLFEAFRDVSAGGDRSAWRRVTTAPLFKSGQIPNTTNQGSIGRSNPQEEMGRVRSLFILPYRRQYLYIQSSMGHWLVIATRPTPKLNGETGNNKDWDILKPRKLSIWYKGRSTGLFQVQRVRFNHGSNTFRVRNIIIDYTPASPLGASAVVPNYDAFRGTQLTWTVPTTPPGYGNPINDLDTCPEPTTITGEQTRTYGFAFTMDVSGASDRFTPFLYGFDVRVARVGGTWPNAPTTISDNPADGLSRIHHARFGSSLKRGEGRIDIEIDDWPTYPATPHYFKADVPIRLFDSVGPVVLFVGLTDPNEVTPLRQDSGILRRFSVHGHDLWRLLTETTLRDQRDWGPEGFDPTVGGPISFGHIFVVDFIVRLAGINTSGAEYPAGGIGGVWDFPLGGVPATFAAESQDLRPPWRPRDSPPDTPASFIERIATLFSGWDVGFHANGQFFYRPKNYFKLPEVTFLKTRAGGSPSYRSPVTFRNVEPEANVLQVEARNETGGPIVSGWWVDRASIANPAAPNFIGRWRASYVKIDGAYTCPELNRIALVLWQAARRRHLLCTFEGDYYQALKVGHVFRLEGYPHLFRLQNYTTEFRRTGWSPAAYEGEVVEDGAFPAYAHG